MTQEQMNGRCLIPRGLNHILSTMEQVPCEGSGQGLSAIQLTHPEDHTDFRYRVDREGLVRIMMRNDEATSEGLIRGSCQPSPDAQ